MKYLSKTPIILSLLLVASVTAKADSASLKEEKEIAWPANVKVKYNYDATEIFSDGLEFRHYLTGSGHRFEIENYGKWLKGPTRPEKSAILKWKADPRMEFSITEFSEGEFIEDLEDENWNAYKRSILQAHPEGKITDDRRGVETTEPPFPPSRDYRVLRFEYTKNGGRAFAEQQVFFQKDGKIYAYAITGPALLMDEYKESHSLMVTRTALIKVKKRS